MKRKLLALMPSMIVFIVSLAVYIFTLSPTISAGDSTEIANAALILGVPHQPSYPFSVILGNLFSRLPIGDNPVWRVNLLSAVLGAMAAMIMSLILTEERFTGGHAGLTTRFLAGAGSLFLSFSATFWQYATRAEVFALNNFFAVCLIWLSLKAAKKEDRRWQYLLAFVAALAFSHHQTIITIFPALAVLIIAEKPEIIKNGRNSLPSLVFWGLLGLFPYFLSLLLLARRDPPLNWGAIADLKGALGALFRVDYGSFSPYLTGFVPELRPVALDQIRFYGESLMADFTILGVFLGGLGIFGAWRVIKGGRKIFHFLTIGLVAGMAFLVYANFPFGDNFQAATAKRFQILPDIFFAGFIGLGIMTVWQKFLDLKLDWRRPVNFLTALLVFGGLMALPVAPFLANFAKADGREYNLVLKYGRDFYLPTEENAILLLSGDISNFVARFIQTTEIKNDKRIVFTPGQFHLHWFIPQLLARYPDLVIPPPRSGNRWTATSQVIEANIDHRPIYISPELAAYDPEVEKKYVLWPSNLLFKVRRKGEEAKLEDYREESNRIWQSLDLPLFARVRKNRPLMEEAIIGYYGRYFYNLGYMYESVKLYEDAIREYKRALEIEPALADSAKNLGIIFGYKIKPPDYRQAIAYLERYLVILPTKEEEAEAARVLIRDFYFRLSQEEASRVVSEEEKKENDDVLRENEK